MNFKNTTYYQNWAYDINKDPLFGGELWDVNVIDQSIEMILSTVRGERLFNPSFGSNVPLRIFETITPDSAISILQDIVDAIKQWEDRITIIEKQVKMIIETDNNSLVLILPYVIKSNNIQNTFKKRITA